MRKSQIASLLLTFALIVFLCFNLFACSSDSNDDYTPKSSSGTNSGYTNKEKDYIVTSRNEAIEMAKNYVEKRLPKKHILYEYYYADAPWVWSSNTTATQTNSGWVVNLYGKMCFYTLGMQYESNEFYAKVTIDNYSGTIDCRDYEIYY